MSGYTDRIAADAQIAAEEWIAGHIADNTTADEEVAADLGREILLEILTRFRPDLLEGAHP